jgi:hypothetical protein
VSFITCIWFTQHVHKSQRHKILQSSNKKCCKLAAAIIILDIHNFCVLGVAFLCLLFIMVIYARCVLTKDTSMSANLKINVD